MAGSVNKVILVGNLGNDPEFRTFQNGDKVCSFSIATSESWKDKQSGERKERTEWHRISILNQGLMMICENYIKKGSKLYIEGQLETRKWQDQNGNDKYSTEVVLRPYRGEITMLDSRNSGGSMNEYSQPSAAPRAMNDSAPKQNAPVDMMEDDIPF